MSSSMGECHRREAVLTFQDRSEAARSIAAETYRVNELDAGEVHVVFGELIEDLLVMNGLWTEMPVALM